MTERTIGKGGGEKAMKLWRDSRKGKERGNEKKIAVKERRKVNR